MHIKAHIESTFLGEWTFQDPDGHESVSEMVFLGQCHENLSVGECMDRNLSSMYPSQKQMNAN
jgi:hypothetical protein